MIKPNLKLFLFFFGGIIFLIVILFPLPIDQFRQSTDYPSEKEKITEKQGVTLILVGDIMLDRGVEYVVEKKGKGDFKFPFLKIADELKKADIVFGNLEGVISDKGEKVGSIYSFRHNPEAIEGLTYAGFNILSLANNHALDYTREALEDCLTRLNKAGISYAGAGFNETEAFSPVIKNIKDTKIGFLAYTNLGPESWKATENNSGIAWINEVIVLDSVKHNIKEAKKLVDILIVSLHAGEEYQKTPTQFQTDFAKMAISAEADIVVGHHPHVTQPNEKYPSTGSGQTSYIFYSLGNFIFDQSFSEETMKGQILKLIIKNGKLTEITPIDIKINNYFQPEISYE